MKWEGAGVSMLQMAETACLLKGRREHVAPLAARKCRAQKHLREAEKSCERCPLKQGKTTAQRAMMEEDLLRLNSMALL